MRHGRSQLRRVARLALVLALLAGACHFGHARSGTAGGQRGHAGGTLGVKGGTLRIASFGDVDSLDPALAYDGFDAVFQRATQRTLLSFDALRPAGQQGEPVPDLVDGMPRLSPDRLTYTLKLRSGIQYYAPELPSGRTVEAKDVVNQVERMFDKVNPSGAQQYVRLIRGADEFAAGKAPTISGLRADGQTLRITLKQPAADFIPILALPFFSPVPEELSSDHALKPGGRHRVGGDYSAHPAAEGPYYVQRHQAGRSLVLARNPNWDPASDPLRRAWVDRIEVRVGVDADQMELEIERGDVDLQGDTPPPAETLPRIASDPELSQRFALELTGGIRYLALETHPAAGPMANLKVRQAIEFAVDKEAIRRARGGAFAGDIASTILTPTTTVGFTRYDLYPTPGNQGDPAKARALLARAGYPGGITVSYLDTSSGFGPAVTQAVEAALARAGIRLKVRQVTRAQQLTEDGQPARRLDHQISSAAWVPDWPGDSARSVIGVLLDGRKITPVDNSNIGEWNNPQENRLIDRAVAEPDRARRAALWAQADRLAMENAVWVPYLYDKDPFFWSARVHNWHWSPWLNAPDLTQVWLDPPSP